MKLFAISIACCVLTGCLSRTPYRRHNHEMDAVYQRMIAPVPPNLVSEADKARFRKSHELNPFQPRRYYEFSWTDCVPQPAGVVYRVYASADTVSWTMIATTTNQFFVVPCDRPQQFYTVAAFGMECGRRLGRSASDTMNGQTKQLTEAILCLSAELSQLREQRRCEFEWLRSHLTFATKEDLKEMETNIMSAFSDWAAKNAPKLARIQAGIDKLQELIETIQNSPGTFTPADQATADEMERVIDSMGTDAESIPTQPTPPA